MNNITDLLDLEDEDLIVSSTLIEGTTKILTIETTLVPHYCPCCSCKMHSRGIRLRKVSHPILQDGYSLILNIKQRRWKCTNEACCYEANDEFRFVNKRRRSTNATDWLIVSAFRDLSVSAADIARRFKTSDTHVLSVFDRYVRLQRLPLTEIVSVDEVFTDMADDCKYALVIQDFKTGLISLLCSSVKSVSVKLSVADISVIAGIKQRLGAYGRIVIDQERDH